MGAWKVQSCLGNNLFLQSGLGPELEVVCPCEASDHNASDQTPCDQSPCGQTLRRGRLLQVRAPKSLCRERLFPKLPCTFHAPMRARRFFVVRYKLSDPHFHCNCFATKRVPFNTYFFYFFEPRGLEAKRAASCLQRRPPTLGVIDIALFGNLT